MIRSILLLLLALSTGLAHADQTPYRIPLTGAALEATTLTAPYLAELPRHRIETEDHGTPAVFEGVWLRDVLIAAGIPLDQPLRGELLAKVLRVTARDDYVAVFALAELAPGLGNTRVLLADRRDGGPLSADHGPLRLIVPGEDRAARWIRQIEALEIIDLGDKARP